MIPDQTVLFAASGPEGFAYAADFLTAAEEASLLADIGTFIGMGLIGLRPDGRVYGALALWDLIAMVIGVVYWKVRSRDGGD